MNLVYSDVCGSMKDKNFSGVSYFIIFIDDVSRKVWAYALKTKYQVFDVFKHFYVMVEKEIGKTLNCIRTDNGGEYIGLFKEYCKSHGIKHD